jgi:diazepam-binding inhibitor (GABA receptor modulating acyl-CoA-binding protein)
MQIPMLTNSPEFVLAAATVKKLKQDPDNSEKADCYGLYKQATIGDVNIEKPSFFYFLELKKWEAWEKFKGTNTYNAEVKYITLVNTLIRKYGVNV